MRLIDAMLVFSTEPDSKKLAGIDLADANSPLSRPLLSNMGYGPEGMILTEEITVPDRIVGLSM